MDLDDPLLLAAVCLLVLAVAGLLLARVTRGVLPALDGAEVRRNALQQLQVVRQPQQIVGVGPVVESRTTLQLPLACCVERDGTDAEAWHAHVTAQQKNGTVVLTVYQGLLKSLPEASAAEQAAIGPLHLAAGEHAVLPVDLSQGMTIVARVSEAPHDSTAISSCVFHVARSPTGTVVAEPRWAQMLSGQQQPIALAPVYESTGTGPADPSDNNPTNDGNCCICLCEPAAVVFYPCRHRVSCRSCAATLAACPLCRQPILQSLAMR